jgi:hypothetical protein
MNLAREPHHPIKEIVAQVPGSEMLSPANVVRVRSI